MRRKLILGAAAVIAVAVLAAQAFQPDRTNPPVNPAATFQAVVKPSPTVTSVVYRACRDCHSNETVWPWYSQVAPMSWLVAKDVKNGRARLNFSRWDLYSPEMSKARIQESCDQIRKGAMPLPTYVPLHPEAKLSQQDVSAFCAEAER